jgi:hypothetical protein
MPDARIQIANAALAKIGSRDMQSWDEDTERARAVVISYDLVKGACFGHPHRWRFATRTFKLNQLAETIDGWRYAYERPGVALSAPLRVMGAAKDPRHPLRDFDDAGNRLYANEPEIWASYICDVDPEFWPGSFKNLFVTALAAELAIPEAQDANLFDAFTTVAWGGPQELRLGGLVRVAINADISGGPMLSTPVDPDPLTSARFTW